MGLQGDTIKLKEFFSGPHTKSRNILHREDIMFGGEASGTLPHWYTPWHKGIVRGAERVVRWTQEREVTEGALPVSNSSQVKWAGVLDCPMVPSVMELVEKKTLWDLPKTPPSRLWGKWVPIGGWNFLLKPTWDLRDLRWKWHQSPLWSQSGIHSDHDVPAVTLPPLPLEEPTEGCGQRCSVGNVLLMIAFQTRTDWKMDDLNRATWKRFKLSCLSQRSKVRKSNWVPEIKLHICTSEFVTYVFIAATHERPYWPD